MVNTSTSLKVRIQAPGKASTSSTSTITSNLQLYIQLFLWLLSPFRNYMQIFIGLEQSCPDASKHFSALPKYTTDLFAHKKPVGLYLLPREDHEGFVRKAYKRYQHRKYSQTDQPDRSFSVDNQGVIQGVLEWQTYQERNASPIYNTLQNCTLTKIDKSAAPILVRQLSREFGTFSFPWTTKEDEFGTWQKCVEYSFFGSDRNWTPLCFRRSLENLTIFQIKNRIAVLGESIGWTPDVNEETQDSGDIVAFRQEINATCFFCFDQKPLWQMCILHCAHISCLDCVKRNYKMCLGDTSKLPPRCCQGYPLMYTSVAAENTKDLEKLARWIVTERNPSPVGKCYACRKEIWYGAAYGDVGLCVSCEERTCLKCGVRWHDFSRVRCRLGQLSGFVSIVVTKKWAQCYSCGIVVERSVGCAHIKCRCGAEFCYHCGGKWPKCPCRTTGKKLKLDITRDQAVETAGERYSKTVSTDHRAKALESERKYEEVVDVLKLLKIMKIYQENVVREIDILRARLGFMIEKNREDIELRNASALRKGRRVERKVVEEDNQGKCHIL